MYLDRDEVYKRGIPSSTIIRCISCRIPVLLTTSKIFPTDEYRVYLNKMEPIRNRVIFIGPPEDDYWSGAAYECKKCGHRMRMFEVFDKAPKEPLKISHLERVEGEIPERKRYCGNLYRRQIKYRRKK